MASVGRTSSTKWLPATCMTLLKRQAPIHPVGICKAGLAFCHSPLYERRSPPTLMRGDKVQWQVERCTEHVVKHQLSVFQMTIERNPFNQSLIKYLVSFLLVAGRRLGNLQTLQLLICKGNILNLWTPTPQTAKTFQAPNWSSLVATFA